MTEMAKQTVQKKGNRKQRIWDRSTSRYDFARSRNYFCNIFMIWFVQMTKGFSYFMYVCSLISPITFAFAL